MASRSSSRPSVGGGVGSVIYGASKAQASLAKIMAVISTVPPSDLTVLNSSKPDGNFKAAASVVDLSLRLDLVMEEGGGGGYGRGHDGLATDPPPHVATAAEDRSSEVKCDEEEAIKEEISEITNVERCDQRKGSSSSSESEDGRKSEGGLDLLIQVLGDELQPLLPPVAEQEGEKDTEKVEEDTKRPIGPPTKTKTKRRSRETTMGWLDLYGETAPLVRSKRGRNQALPWRYRDTLLEPWAKLPSVNGHGCRRQQQDH